MKSNVIKKYARIIAHALCAGLIAAAAIAPASALADATPSVLGKTIGEWSAQWWKWAYSIPTPFNPMLDTSGAYCDVGQKGPMWFLAGWFFGDGTPVVRACSVPRGKYILFPIISATWIQTPLDDPTLKETDWRRLANEFLPPSVGGDMEATLDGEPIIFNPKTPITQSQSPVFEATFPEDNVYSAFGYLATDLTDQPIVSDGWWVVLPPLAPGEHVLHFRAGQSQQNVTYHLTVGKRQHH